MERYHETEAFKINIPMLKVDLIRTTDNGVQTVGKFYISGDQHFTCDTLERTYADNKRGISCIPAGKYHCAKKLATKNIPYEHITILNVPNRDGIAIHKGNLFTSSRGCILVGKGWGDINNDNNVDILNSSNTFASLMSFLPDEFILSITEAIKTKPHEKIV